MSPLAPGLVSVSVTTVSGTYKDLADFNLIVENWPDLLSGPLREYPQGSRPGNIDTALLSEDPLYKPAQFQLVGTIYARSASYAVASMLTDLRNLKGWMARAVAMKVDCLDTSIYRACKTTGITAQDIGVVGATPAMRVTISLEAADPLWYATSTTVNALTTSLTEQALGAAPSLPVIRFTGAPTGLTLTYADSAGATVKTLTVTGLETSGAAYTEIDMDRKSIVQSISSTIVNKIALLDPATDFFALDPKHGDTATPVWPKLKYSLSGGSVSGVSCTYPKRWF